MLNHPMGIGQTGEDVLLLQPGIALEESFEIVTGRKHCPGMLYGQSAHADDGFAAEDGRIVRNAFQQLVFVHRKALLSIDRQ